MTQLLVLADSISYSIVTDEIRTLPERPTYGIIV